MPGDTSQCGPQSGQPCSRQMTVSRGGYFPPRILIYAIFNAKQCQHPGIALVSRESMPHRESAASQNNEIDIGSANLRLPIARHNVVPRSIPPFAY